MVKTKFKKAVSLMLAAVMSLTAFTGIGATTAFAAVGEKADVYLVDYPRSGDTNNNGEWGHGNLNYMNGWKGLSTKYTGLRAMGSYSGNIAYCIEPGTGQRTGDTLTEKDENFFNNISPNGTISGDDIRLLIGRILQYGYRGGISTSWKSQNESDANCIAHAYATQILIWETIVGERDAGFNHVSTSGYNAVLECVSTAHPLRSKILSYYNSMVTSVQNHTKVPSFCTRSSGSAKVNELEWNGSKYVATLTDTNGVLGNYNFSANIDGVSFSVSGNKLTVSMEKAPSKEFTITAAKKNGVRRGVVVWSDGIHQNGNGIQDVVTYAQEVSDPVSGFVKMKVSYGSCQIVKTSEDGKVDGIQFTIKNRYSVVYTYKDDDGNQHQKWETFDTNADAKKRKTQIEFEQQSGTFIIPNATTVADLLEEYCSVYGVNNWAMSTYRSKKGLMYNYIIPLIGDVKLDELTPRLMDKFYQSLLKVKTKVVQNKKPKNEYLTVHTVREIHKFLRSAFNQAVKWELMTRNPVLNATLPKEEHQKREIWTAETLMHALEVCDDDILALAINLSFACSLRMGEMLGLTWDCIDISEESLKENNASIFVDKELQRVNRDVMEVLDNKDIIRVFPRTLSNTNTSLVLKTPKTKTSVRKIFLPSTVAQMLLERKKQIDEMKELFGDEYLDYDLVFCHSSGRPMEGQVINRALKKLIQDNDLPDVVFHSFRHASITYKLKWNGGDMKSVQGDSGHARMDMVADVYSHIIDEDRRYNAQKFEEQFYNAKGLKNAEEGKTAPMPKFETSVELLDPMAEVQKESEVEKEKPAENSTDENAALLTKLLSNPETAALLKALAKTI